MSRRTPGEGSIVKRGDRWQGSLQVDGIRKYVYGKTRQEVVEKLNDLKRQASVGGALPTPGRRTVNELLDAYLETAQMRLKPTSAAHYRIIADLYLRPSLGSVLLARLTPRRVQAHIARLGDKPVAAGLALHVLRQACKLAVRWRWLADNPCEKVVGPRHRAKRKAVWTLEQLHTFLEGAKGHRLFPFWYVLLASGCRPGELLALEWSDVDWQSGCIRIGKTMGWVKGQAVVCEPKTASAVRTVPLPPEALAMLKRQMMRQMLERGAVSNLVFTNTKGGALNRHTAAAALRTVERRLGLPTLSLHGLRHLHASLLLAQGVPVTTVSKRLGHANPGITLEVYAHQVGEGDEAVAAIRRALEAVGRP